MTNEELKKKIVEIINDGIIHGEDNCGMPTSKTIENIADALIAAGIVDKSDYASMKETAVRYKAEVSKAGARVKEAEAEANRYEMLYSMQARDMALAERKAFTYAAEIEHLNNKLNEAERRAARAEMAFSKLVHEMYEHGIRPMCDEKFFVESRLKDAEKELAEEEE